MSMTSSYCCVCAFCTCALLPAAPPCPTGKDATQDFEEIGHSNSARELLEKYHIGGFAVSARQRPACITMHGAQQNEIVMRGHTH